MPELDLVIARNGTAYALTNATRFVLSDEGTGMPDIDYVTSRGPFQDGETIRDWFLKPRVLQYHIRQKYCSRNAYWEGRQALLDILAPSNRLNLSRSQPQVVLRKIRGNGVIRDINVVIQQGPVFQPRSKDVWDEWAIDEILRFTAHDPTYYDPITKTIILTASGAGFPYTFPFDFSSGLDIELEFPITFPITFSSFNPIIDIVYNGTWPSFPKFVIQGPAQSIRIVNTTTGVTLFLAYRLTPTDVVTIDLTYGFKQVLLNGTTSLLGYILGDSDIGSFSMVPGVNNLDININGAGFSTLVTMSYLERYIGI